MSWWGRLRNTLRPRRLDEDLAAEIRDHIERRTADLEESGLSAAAARRRAEVVFGNATLMREQSRDVRLWGTLADSFQDVRYAWRGLRRNPVFAATAVLSLGLAVGANTAIYSIVDAAVLRPLAVPRPERLVTLSDGSDDTFSYPLFEALGTAAGDSARLALVDAPNRVEARLDRAGSPYEEVTQQFVSPDAFDVLGVSPTAGRLLSADDDRQAAPRFVAVLSYEYWQRRFGGNPAIVTQRLTVNGRTYAIQGVTRAGFSGVESGRFVDVWLPVTTTDPGVLTNAGFRPFHVLGRLSPGVTRARLAAQLQPAFHRHEEARIEDSMPAPLQRQLREMTIRAMPGSSGVSDFRRNFSRPLWILLGVSVCMLLIACANVASLLLARSAARQSEMALRLSLGARRARLVRQLLTESLLISALAGLCGWVVARAAAPALVMLVSTATDPVRLDLALDTRVLFFCAAVCAFSALAFGLLPALQATGSVSALRYSGGEAGRSRLGRLFVGVQVAFAFCLVSGGSGFLFSLRNLAAVEKGFDAQGVTVLTVSNELGYQERDRQLSLMHQIRDRAGALPTVQGAAAGWMAIFSGARRLERVVLPGKPASEREETFYRVSRGYFGTLRTPLLNGRDFTDRDNDDEPVPTVVNRAFARRYFASENVLGLEFRRTDGTRHRIIGLAADSYFGDLRNGPEAIAYMPMKPPRAFTLYVRSALGAGAVAKLVEREAATLGSGMRVRDVATVETLVGNTILRERLLASLGGAFGLIGLVLAAVGLFGLLNYSVTRRTKEIGIRAALGARQRLIYGLVLRDLTGTVVGGLAVGLTGSLLLMRVTRSLLFGIQAVDPLVIGTSMAVFLGAAVIAVGLPARRAASIDPVVALRNE